MSSLIEVFMPDDLCARCDDQEPKWGIFVIAVRGDETAKLCFCTEACKSAFIAGYWAIRSTEQVQMS